MVASNDAIGWRTDSRFRRVETTCSVLCSTTTREGVKRRFGESVISSCVGAGAGGRAGKRMVRTAPPTVARVQSARSINPDERATVIAHKRGRYPARIQAHGNDTPCGKRRPSARRMLVSWIRRMGSVSRKTRAVPMRGASRVLRCADIKNAPASHMAIIAR